jgi:PhoPQ-activated pathogenicity-related protein
MPMTSWRALPLWLVAFLGAAAAGPARADLREYLKKPEPAFTWKVSDKSVQDQGTVYDIELVSQTWEDITWKHHLQVYQPTDVKPARTMLLFNTGGRNGNKPRDTDVALGLELAKRVQAPCAILYQVPNQPLFGNKTEDTLIAETFVRYLKTKDEDWPLLFPMVKSVVKAMDALQAFSKQEWDQPLDGFVISGASKRGWTTWLTAAGGDPRVKAIAPMVIDTLNMPAQLPHQLESFGGKFSEEIGDYTGRGLAALSDTPDGKRLFQLVDPYSYRDKLTLPKLVINGNNDNYWATDALNLYWDGLKGDKWVLYVPNAGHSLQQKTTDGPELTRARNGLAAFARAQITGKPLPRLEWKHDDADGKLRLTVTCKPVPLAARLWVAEAPTRDFRKAEWKERPATLKEGTVTGLVEPPATGCLAFYGEVEYELDGLRYDLSTQLRIAGKPEAKEK